MNVNWRKAIGRLILLAVLTTFSGATHAENVILFIGDGMGFEQLKAASLYEYGEPDQLNIHKMPAKGESRTDPAVGSPTDSAAGATALAAGRKVENAIVSLDVPGEGGPLETILERAQKLGMSTGMITTAHLSHATPAAFAAHSRHRDNYDEIGEQVLQTRPNVLLGGGYRRLNSRSAAEAGYSIVRNRTELLELDPAASDYVAGIFTRDGYMPYEKDGLGDLPHIYEMAPAAIRVLERNPRGFFLMIEGGRIDHAGHDNRIEYNIQETLAFDRAVKAVLDWAEGCDDTLVVVTADHETGGLKVVNGAKGEVPEVTWISGNHTAVNVPLFAWGLDSERLAGEHENTFVHTVMSGVLDRVEQKVESTEAAAQAAN